MDTRTAPGASLTAPRGAAGSSGWQALRHGAVLVLGLLVAALSACGGVSGVYAIPDSTDPVVFGISMLSRDDGWAVGAANHYRTKGLIAHYQNGSWQPIVLPDKTPTLRSVAMVSPRSAT